MTTKRVFVIKNQFDQYLDKHSGWLSGKDANALFRVDYHDQALNTLLEINSKDIELRGRIIEVDIDDKKRPVVDVSESALAMDKNPGIIDEESTETEENGSDDETDIVDESETLFSDSLDMSESLDD